MSQNKNLWRRAVILLKASVFTACAFAPVFASAQASFPSKPLTLIVAYAPGGPTDIIARALAQEMGAALGQSVVVENRSGAGGVIGTSHVAKAVPDGYTIGWGTSSQLVMNAGVYKSLPFDIENDLKQVGLAVKFPLVMVANKRVPNLKEFVAAAQAAPRKFTYGSAGNGAVSHVMMELFIKEAGIDVMHVPYRGATAVLTDLSGGRVDVFLDTLTATGPTVDSGNAHWIGIGGKKRSASRPSVPTFAEQGFPNFDPYSWTSVFVAAKTAPEIIAKLNVALNTALRSPNFKSRLQQFDAELLGPSTPQAAEEFGFRERAKWVPFIRRTGILAE